MERDDAKSVGDKIAALGIAYCDCPVSGLPERAKDGTLKLMFGGERSSYTQVNELLHCCGESLFCGGLGAGQAMKAVNNIIYNINIVALCEVLPLATAVGLDPEQLAEVVTSGSSRSFASEHFVPRMLDRHFADDFPLESAYKDISNIKTMGQNCQASMPVINAMISTYESAIAAGYGAEPKSAMLKLYEKSLGVMFQRE